MGNIVANADGVARVKQYLKGVKMADLLGRAIVVCIMRVSSKKSIRIYYVRRPGYCGMCIYMRVSSSPYACRPVSS